MKAVEVSLGGIEPTGLIWINSPITYEGERGRAATSDQCWISLRKWALRASICFNSAAAFSSPRSRNGRASLFIKASSRSSAATVHAG